MWHSIQQIAVGPNKRCTVEPCGSTDSFYRCHKEQLWKTPEPFTLVGGEMAFCIVPNCCCLSVVKLGFKKTDVFFV